MIQRIAVLLLPVTLACAQQKAPRPAFEVASIKPAPPPQGGLMTVAFGGGPGSNDPGRWSAQNMSLRNLVAFAYNLRQYEIAIPAWTDQALFDIHAKAPEGATKDDLKLMVQSLLEERFKLAFHREQREAPVYELVVAKNGPKLKEAVGPPPEELASGAPGILPKDAEGYPILRRVRGGSMAMMNGRARMANPEMTMDALAERLSAQVGKPVTDATGLKGKYDVVLSWVTDYARTRPVAAGAEGAVPAAQEELGPTIFAALQQQLGLKLEQKKGAIPVLVVDKVEKTPTEN